MDYKLIATKRHEKTRKSSIIVAFCAFLWPSASSELVVYPTDSRGLSLGMEQRRSHHHGQSEHRGDQDKNGRVNHKDADPDGGPAIARPLARAPLHEDEHEDDGAQNVNSMVMEEFHHRDHYSKQVRNRHARIIANHLESWKQK